MCAIRIAMILFSTVLAGPSLAADRDWNAVGEALGKPGTVQPGGVYRVGLPRSDLKVSLDGVVLKPGFALGSWLAFEPVGDQVMVMGDLVLTQDEVNPVMKKLEEGGIAITALSLSASSFAQKCMSGCTARSGVQRKATG
jgi:hypothetical protein